MNALITLRVRFNKFRDRLGLFLIAFTLVALTITGCASAPSHDQDIALNLPNEPLVFQYELIMRNGKVISDEEIAADLAKALIESSSIRSLYRSRSTSGSGAILEKGVAVGIDGSFVNLSYHNGIYHPEIDTTYSTILLAPFRFEVEESQSEFLIVRVYPPDAIRLIKERLPIMPLASKPLMSDQEVTREVESVYRALIRSIPAYSRVGVKKVSE